ncbi:MAG: L,D-transpeptidase family protein [Verrucomicrobiaceae bacterium]|nr:L,D-transpeptidase family protein [Verrucomicrobiaceae bacterium]
MKGHWINSLIAFSLPPLVGAGLCIAFINILKHQELFMQPVKAPAADVASGKKQPQASPAELRASLPLDKRYVPIPEPVKPSLPATNAEQDKIKQAATEKAAREQASSKAESAAPAPPAASPAGVTLTFKPQQAWRPILDPIDKYWSTIWPRTDALPAVFQAVLTQDPERIARLVAMGISPHEKTVFGDTALCAAARTGQHECIRVLSLCGVNLNEPGRENQAPILVASMRRNTKVLETLTSLGVDPNTRFKSPVTRELIERCTIKDLRNAMESDRGVTPLICCAARGDVEGAVALMKAGARAGMSTSRYHRYPINFAATQGYLFLMRVLLGRDPDSEPDTLVTIDLSSQRAWVTKHGKVIASTSVSTGRDGYRTPAGRYVITDKHRSHTSTLYHVAMPWFMRLNCSAIGLHSGYVTGRPASHGCIRLPYDKAKQFFGLTDVGDEVQIVY